MRRFTVIDCDQRTEAWLQARCGRLTSTCAADLLKTLKSGGEPAERRDLRLRLVCERLTGQPQENSYVNADMRRGVELEPQAFALYEAITGSLVQRTGFLQHTDLLVGCSLDGHVGDFDGLVELKVPRSATHLRYWKANCLPAEYKPQITHHLFVSGAPWVDFCSYDPRFPPPLQLFRVRVPRNDSEIDAYEFTVRAFLSEVEKEVEEVQRLLAQAEAAA